MTLPVPVSFTKRRGIVPLSMKTIHYTEYMLDRMEFRRVPRVTCSPVQTLRAACLPVAHSVTRRLEVEPRLPSRPREARPAEAAEQSLKTGTPMSVWSFSKRE